MTRRLFTTLLLLAPLAAWSKEQKVIELDIAGMT